MSPSASPPLPSLSSDQENPRTQQQPQLPPMSFRSSVGSMPSTVGPVEGPATARADLAMKSAVDAIAREIGPSGYYADLAGAMGSSWISRLRRPSTQPPPRQAAQTSPSIVTAGRSAGTEGSSVAGGERGSGVLVPGPAVHPSTPGPEPGPFLNPAYHVQRLCLSPVGNDDNLHRNARQQQHQPQLAPPRQVAADRVRGFGPFRFSDVRDQDPGDGVNANRPLMPPDRAPPPANLLPPHYQQPHPQPPQRAPTPIPSPWILTPNGGAEPGCANPRRPPGFFPLFANMVRAGEEPPKTSSPILCAAEGSDAKPSVLLRQQQQQQRHLRASSAGKGPFSSYSEGHRALTSHHSNPVFPLLTDTSTGGSTVRLASEGPSSSRGPSFLSRQSSERLRDLIPAPSSTQSLTDAVFPTDGGGRWRGLPAFGLLSRVSAATTSKTSCLPSDPWRANNAALLAGNAEDDSQRRQFLNKDATAIPINRKLPTSTSRSRPAAAACGNEDRFSFWNMGRFWPSAAAAASERKRLHAPDAVLSPIKCRKLGNQG